MIISINKTSCGWSFSLVLDVSKLKVFPKDVEENLGELYKDYTDFKKIYVVTPEEVVTKM